MTFSGDEVLQRQQAMLRALAAAEEGRELSAAAAPKAPTRTPRPKGGAAVPSSVGQAVAAPHLSREKADAGQRSALTPPQQARPEESSGGAPVRLATLTRQRLPSLKG